MTTQEEDDDVWASIKADGEEAVQRLGVKPAEAVIMLVVHTAQGEKLGLVLRLEETEAFEAIQVINAKYGTSQSRELS